MRHNQGLGLKAGIRGFVIERLKRLGSALSPVGVAMTLLIILLAVQSARLFWAVVVPLGPVGNWRPTVITASVVDPAFDPFFRLSSGSEISAITSLSLKLFGVRLDEATGRGSAIIATPDGVQSSFGVGEVVMPGVVLKSVALDHVVLDRGGAEEKLFIDQSVPAPVAATAPEPVVLTPMVANAAQAQQ
jgi:general secretion pathway protein C